MYSTENKINVMAEGELRNVCGEDVSVMRGSYDYYGPDGVKYTVDWYADETGDLRVSRLCLFLNCLIRQVFTQALPTSPSLWSPIILRSLLLSPPNWPLPQIIITRGELEIFLYLCLDIH